MRATQSAIGRNAVSYLCSFIAPTEMLPLTPAHQFPPRQKISSGRRYHFLDEFCRGTKRKNRLLGHPLLASFALAALVWLLLVGLVWSALLDSAELEGYDLLVYRRGYPNLPANLVIVDFDEATVAALACYPVPRQSVDDVLEKVEAGQPSYVGFDLWLTELRCGGADNGRLALDLTRAHNVILTDSFPAQDRADDNIPAELRRNPILYSEKRASGGSAFLRSGICRLAGICRALLPGELLLVNKV
jgi:hypothetical protein